MNRQQMLYQIHYSYTLECISSRFYDRHNKFFSFTLIVLSSAVISNFFNPIVIGLLIAIVSAYKSVGAFESSAESSRVQASRYLKLYNSEHLIVSDEEFLHEILKIQDDDRIPNPTIAKLASTEANKLLDIDSSNAKKPLKERVYSYLFN